MKKLALCVLALLMVLLVACPQTPTPDAEKPTLTVTTPREGEGVETTSATFSVTGTAKDDVAVSKLTMKLNDGTVEDITSSLKEDTSFSSEVTLIKGENTIVVTAMDAAGKSAVITRKITLIDVDAVRPTVRIASPRYGMTTPITTVTIEGTAKDNVGVVSLTLKIGTTETPITDKLVDGKFTLETTFEQGANKFFIIAKDAAGNTRSSEGKVVIDDIVAPTLAITSPTEDGITAAGQTLTLTGTATDDLAVSRLTVQVNGGNAANITNTLTNGTFSTPVSLVANQNIITVTAQDAKGNSTQVIRTVSFNPTATSTLSGHIWFDANGNGMRDAGEANAVARSVFLDTNNNAKLDAGEVSVKTDADGAYAFTNLAPGTYNVNQVLAFGERFATAASSSTTAADTVDISNIQWQAKTGTRIVGGVNANISDFPFMVALGGLNPDGSFSQFCGATLIAAQHAVTAAHCVEGSSSGLAVLLGTDELNNKTGLAVKVRNVISHPEYNGSTSEGYDVALLELETAVDLSKYYTVDMIDDSTVQFTATDTVATATGWGALTSGGAAPSRLQVVHTKIVDPAVCERAYAKYGLKNFDTQICAGVPEGGIDACQGDSGGPLFVRGELNGEKRWFHAGATSWGEGCAFAGLPGIWARTSALHSWIVAHAIAPSSGQQVTVTDSNVSDINFANLSALRPFVSEISPRWQTTALTLKTENTANVFVAPNVDLDFAWNIFAEESAPSSYTCTFIVMQRGTVLSNETVSCGIGENTYTLNGGIDAGDRTITLNVETSEGRQSRTRVVGLLADSAEGTLLVTDTHDPDYKNETYYLDYFELKGLTVGDKVTLVLQTSEFDPFMGLYNKDKRDPQAGGGPLAKGQSTLTFEVKENINYLLGVSSYSENQSGAYKLLISQGTLNSFTFPTPQ